jgi:hypothetical protein
MTINDPAMPVVRQPAKTSVHMSSIEPARSLAELEACLQTDVTWRAADALLRGATCPDCRRKLRPLACELPLRFLFITHAALYRLIYGEAGGGGNVELATPRDIEFRHSVGYRHN